MLALMQSSIHGIVSETNGYTSKGSKRSTSEIFEIGVKVSNVQVTCYKRHKLVQIKKPFVSCLVFGSALMFSHANFIAGQISNKHLNATFR